MALIRLRGNQIIPHSTPTSALVLDWDDHLLRRDGATPMLNTLNMGGNRISNVATPIDEGDAVNYKTLIAKLSGLKRIQSLIDYVTTEDQFEPLQGLRTIQDQVLVANKLILLTGQINAAANGPWRVSNERWDRPWWWAKNSSQVDSLFFVNDGPFAGSKWYLLSDVAIVVECWCNDSIHSPSIASYFRNVFVA